MNTTDNNKLIAEFMGMEHCYRPYGDGFMEVKENGSCVELEDLQYHTSWDWLMPVVETIKDGAYNGIILEKVDEIDYRLIFDLRKENIYKAVVEFINQYNKQT
jgi:hypothetical protein|tara:strand:- start:541 stop:849 length:309 start_codon:yes stop_codon:yes gene_type:complete